jgi:lactoylglutathione lyase
MRIAYAIVFVSDMKRSLAFYRDLVGLPVRFESSHWTEFETVGATLALHLSDGHSETGERTDREAPGTCRPGLSVPNLSEFHHRIVAQGVKCLQVPKDVFGSRVAMYLDPDGLAISVGEDRSSNK